MLRKRKRRKKVDSVQLDPIEAEGTDLEPLATDTDPTAPIRAEEAKDAVHDSLSGLPVQVRKALELREFEGLRYREIAELLGIPIGTVMSRLYTARRHLAAAQEDAS